MKKILILGGGTAGTLAANRLRRMYSENEAEIVVVDQDDNHIYQPGLLFVPFGLKQTDDLIRSRQRQLHSGITYTQSVIDHVDIARDRVLLSDGSLLSYDVLIVATGAVLLPDETEGLTGPAWNRDVFTFYSPEGAQGLAEALRSFDHGRLVVNVIDMPIKCPVAPLEFAFLADWFFTQSGRRDRVELTYVTPLDGAFTKPIASEMLGGTLEEKGIHLVTGFNTGEVDGETKQLVGYDGRTVPFDLAVVVPLHGGAAYVGRSEGLGDELNFIHTDERTLQSRAKPNIFAMGDAAGIPTSKAGSVADFEGEVVCDNVRSFLNGEELAAHFDGHTNCFIETGYGKALLIDFNYETEPLPGHYPLPVGLPLLKESRANHAGKMMFEWLYWHVLLPGRALPGFGSAMPERGKVKEPATLRRS
ncbi:MAG TPA: FAD/NAD(P)-binding oxidoreductase [Chloroflexota bacterium]